MLKRLILVAVATLVFTVQCFVGNANALNLSVDSRTIQADATGTQVTFSNERVAKGERIFTDTCASCHNGGRTKTNPNVTLSGDSLAGAEPPRNSVAGIVDYLKHPTSYDGENDLYELHPNTARPEIYASMRNLSDEDLENVSAFILSQQKVRGFLWGSGKVYN